MIKKGIKVKTKYGSGTVVKADGPDGRWLIKLDSFDGFPMGYTGLKRLHDIQGGLSFASNEFD